MRRARRRRGNEKELADQLELSIPESKLFTELQKLEKRLDVRLAQKNLQIQRSTQQLPVATRTLRVSISHEYHNQDREEGDAEYPPAWTLKIQGRFLEPDRGFPRLKLTTVLKNVLVLVTEVGPGGRTMPIEWNHADSPIVADGIEIKQLGRRECNAKVCLHLRRSPELFQLSRELVAAIGGQPVDTKIRVLGRVWEYARVNQLFDDETSAKIVCPEDEPLGTVFSQETVDMDTLAKEISGHLGPLDPYVFDHTISLTGAPTVESYDIQVPVPLPQGALIRKLPVSQSDRPMPQRDNESFEEKIKTLVGKYHRHKRRRKALLTFANGPERAVELMTTAQRTKFRRVGAGGVNSEDSRRSQYYYNEWMHDAVDTYLEQVKNAAVKYPVPDFLARVNKDGEDAVNAA